MLLAAKVRVTAGSHCWTRFYGGWELCSARDELRRKRFDRRGRRENPQRSRRRTAANV